MLPSKLPGVKYTAEGGGCLHSEPKMDEGPEIDQEQETEEMPLNRVLQGQI